MQCAIAAIVEKNGLTKTHKSMCRYMPLLLGGLTPRPLETCTSGRDLAGMTNAERTELRKTTVGFVLQKNNLPLCCPRKTISGLCNTLAVVLWRSTRISGCSCTCWASRTDEPQTSCALRRPAATGGVRSKHRELSGDPGSPTSLPTISTAKTRPPYRG